MRYRDPNEQQMVCWTCGRKHTWPYDFPERYYAKCWDCFTAEYEPPMMSSARVFVVVAVATFVALNVIMLMLKL